MGDPKKPKKKYSTPSHPWQKNRIEEEKIMIKEYGLKNKKEIWKAESTVTKFKDQFKKLVAQKNKQADVERKQLYDKVLKLSLIGEESKLDEVLDLGVKDILNRRLQTIIVLKSLARTMKQARQMITHGHIAVNGKKMTAPSYIVKKDEEVSFAKNSGFVDDMHPERVVVKKKETPKEERPKDKRMKRPRGTRR